MTDWKAYGQDVKTLREARGWSQAELGVHAGTSQANIRDVERGDYKTAPHPDTIRGIQEAFGRTPGEEGYKLTSLHIGEARADVIANNGRDPLANIIAAIPDDKRADVIEMLRRFAEDLGHTAH